jgi:hypothetical protein
MYPHLNRKVLIFSFAPFLRDLRFTILYQQFYYLKGILLVALIYVSVFQQGIMFSFSINFIVGL